MFHIEFYQSLILSKKEMRRIDDGNRPEKPLGVKHKKVKPIFIQVLWKPEGQKIVGHHKNHLENSG